MEKLMTRNAIKTLGFIRAAFVVAAGIPFLTAVSAFAQEPSPAPAAAEVERVIVVGSNIPTAEEVGANPILNLNRDLIAKSGERNTEQLLRDLPVANANGVPISNNATGFTPGASSISLRAFDPSATLVLIDGKRVAPYPAGQGGTSSFIDLYSIPRAAIDTIEILKDGASSTYGADAVAGVVNIKLYKEYHGAEVDIEYGNTLDKDAAIYSGDVLFGTGDDKTQVVGEINFYHHNSLFNRDRGNSANPPFLSSNASPENLQVSGAVAAAAGGVDLMTTSGIEFAHAPFGTGGTSPASDYHYSTGRTSTFNFNQFSGSFPTSERYGGYTAFSTKVCEDQLVIYADMFYQQVKTHNELAPGATGSFQTPGQVTLAIPPHMDLNGVSPPLTPTYAATGVDPHAYNPFNPFNQIISGGSRARLAEFGNRLYDNTTDAYMATAGIKGDKLFDGNWGYDAGFRYSDIRNTSIDPQQVSVSRFNRILNANDPIFDPSSSQFIGTTIPYNPFGDFHVPIPSNNATVAFASVIPKEVDTSKLTELDVNIYSTQLFTLPGGPVGFAVGGQFRRENISQFPDELMLQGDIVGSSKSSITHAGRKDYAMYGESQIPITSPAMNIPGLHSVELTAAGRFEAFENNDTNVAVPKVGLRWQPFDEQLTIRSTWGEGFREPSLFELFASPTFALTTTKDRVTGLTEPETATSFASNPNLKPEDSRAWSGGIVYTPKWIPTQWGTVTLSVDLWDIERNGVVVTPSSQEVVNRAFEGVAAGGPFGLHLLPGEVVQLDPTGQTVNFVQTSFQNAGRQNARGVDLGLQYQIQTGFGTFTWLSQATYLDSFIFQSTSQSLASEVSNRSVGGLGGEGFLKWKGISRLDWADWPWKGLDLIWTVHYLDGYHEHLFSGAPEPPNPGGNKDHWVHGTWFQDAQLSYLLLFTPPVETQPVAGYSKGSKEVVAGKDGKAVETAAAYSMPCWQTILNNSKITLGVNDIFGEDPPQEFGPGFGNSNGYPGFQYDNIGRFVYIELLKKF